MRSLIPAVLLVLFLVPGTAAAQEHEDHETDHMHAMEVPDEGLRAALIQDVDQLEQKLMGLAQALAGHYDWRPAEGVRSVGELFGHVANGNFMLPSLAGLDREMADQDFEQVDPETLMEGLEHSFTHVRRSIAAVPDDELDHPVTMFGQDATKRQVLLLLVTHMHEHLGQAIAYARMNGVAPPWSAGP